MFGGPGTVIEKNGLTLTINNDGTATLTGTSTEATLFEAKVTDSSFIYPPGTYRVPHERMMLSGFAVNGGNFGGNRWGAKDHTISEPFVLFRIFLEFAANKTFNETFPINIPILNLSYNSDNIYSNKIKYTVDFGRVVTNGEYNWTTGELKDEYENIIAYYPKQIILGFQGFNIFWTGFGNVIGQNKSNTLEKITVLLNEQIPEDAMTSVCDFILKPTTVQAAYGLGNWNLINPEKELSGTEVPLISTKGYLTVQDKDGNIKYNKYLDSMYNHREVSDELTPKGLYKKWSEKFYLTKPPISQTNVGSVWDGSPQMIVYEWEFDKNEFETTGIPAKIQDIPIVTPCFWNDSTSAAKIDGAQMYNTTPYPAVFSYDYETDKYKLTAKGVTGFSINALLTQYSKVYFYYQLETPYLENYYFAMGVGPEDTITFIPDFSEAQPYIDTPNVYQNFYNFLTEFNIDPQVSIFVPRNEYDALSGMSNIAIMLNNENSAAGGDSTVQGYSWIGEGDGVSDYTIQIQQKIDEIYKVSKGGTINLGPGTYKINNSLILYENTILQGNGRTI